MYWMCSPLLTTLLIYYWYIIMIIGVFLWGFIKDILFVSPLLTDINELRMRISGSNKQIHRTCREKYGISYPTVLISFVYLEGVALNIYNCIEFWFLTIIYNFRWTTRFCFFLKNSSLKLGYSIYLHPVLYYFCKIWSICLIKKMLLNKYFSTLNF